MPHVHVGVVEFIVTVAYLLVFTFLWRALTGYVAARSKSAGSVLAAVYS